MRAPIIKSSISHIGLEVSNQEENEDGSSDDLAPTSSKQAREVTVIVADDYDDTRTMLKYVLEAEGCRVVSVSSGMEAVQAAMREQPQLLIVDLDLPDIDGYVVTHLVREHEELRDLPIICITAYEETFPRDEALAAGCSDYITEPITVSKLQEIIRKYLPCRGAK